MLALPKFHIFMLLWIDDLKRQLDDVNGRNKDLELVYSAKTQSQAMSDEDAVVKMNELLI